MMSLLNSQKENFKIIHPSRHKMNNKSSSLTLSTEYQFMKKIKCKFTKINSETEQTGEIYVYKFKKPKW